MTITPEEKSLTPYKKKVSGLISQSQGLDIKTEAQMETAVDYLKQVKDAGKNIKEQKEKLTDPAQETLRRIRALFKPIEDNIREAEGIIKGKMLSFDEIKQKQSESKIEKIEAKVKAGNMDIVKAAKQVEKIEPKNSYEGDAGKIQYRTVKKILIVDKTKIPREYLIPNEVMIRKVLLAGKKIPGIKLVEEKQVASY